MNEIINKLKSSIIAEEQIEIINSIIENKDFKIELIDILVEKLSDQNRGIKDAAYRALINFPDDLKEMVAYKVAPIIEQRQIELRNLAGDILLKLGVYSSKPLIKYLKVEDFDVRKFACDILGLVDNGDNVDIIIQLFDDTDQNVVLSAIEAVGNIFSRNEGKVDKNHILLSLFELFRLNNDNYQPQLIDTIGKIGGNEAEDFLLDIIRNNKDLYLKINAIDSLATVGTSTDICNSLLNEMHLYPKEIQTIVLKTAIAIAYRLESMPEIPPSTREIARKALLDNDVNISSAGLVALGENYNIDDVDYLVKFYDKTNYDTQQYLLFNLLENSNNDIFDKFIDNYFDCRINSDNQSQNLEFILTLQSLWENLSIEKQHFALTKIIKTIIEKNCINKAELIEILANFDLSLLEKVKQIILEEKSKLEDIDDIHTLFNNIFNLK